MKYHENSENHIKASGKYFAPTKQSVLDKVKEHASKSSCAKEQSASDYMKVLFKSAYFFDKKTLGCVREFGRFNEKLPCARLEN